MMPALRNVKILVVLIIKENEKSNLTLGVILDSKEM